MESTPKPTNQAKKLPGAFYLFFSGFIDRVLGSLSQKQSDGDFDADADWAIAEQTPSGARILVWLSVAAVVVLIGWAAFATLDEVTRGEGKVIPSFAERRANIEAQLTAGGWRRTQ